MTLLTADDVLNKKFQATKFREGYEQDEVDEFLDEVVEAMRQLEAENADLKAKLEAANARLADVAEARTTGEQIVREAEDQRNRTLAQLEKERSGLEHKIDELRRFESDYRTRLKSYLQGLLTNVEDGVGSGSSPSL